MSCRVLEDLNCCNILRFLIGLLKMFSQIFQSEHIYRSGDSEEYCLSNSSENLAKKNGFCGGAQEREGSCMDVDLFGSVIGFFENNTPITEHVMPKPYIDQHMQQLAGFGSPHDLCLDVVSPQVLSCGNEFRKIVGKEFQCSEMIEPEKKGQYFFPSTSFEILNKYGSRCRKLNDEKINDREDTMSDGPILLSTETLIQFAAEKFIQSTSPGKISMLSHPYPSSVLSSSVEGSEGVQLVQNLLYCAEKIGKQQYEGARKLLQEFDKMGSSSKGNPVQRLVFYFIEALHERIDRETGRVTPKGLGKKFEDPMEALKVPNTTLIAFHNELPLSQITKFAGIQAILDHVAETSKVHVIDFEIRTGSQFTILMQALVARCEHPIELLKITAVGTNSKEALEETGRRLTSFAESLNLKFSFSVVVVADILDLDECLLKVDADAKVAVYAAYTLTHMIGRPNHLEHLMRVIRTINPCVMVVTEVEANCNSPIFVDRFVEALFFYGACFDSMAECMKNDEKNRHFAESTCFAAAIRNIVASEGEERKIRHVDISIWRAFFTSFGLEESQLSMSSMYQANLILKNFTCRSSCTFDTDGKSLIIGWKGTPLSSLSAWKFHSYE